MKKIFLLIFLIVRSVFCQVDDSYTKLLLHMNGSDASTTFTDESGKSITAGGNAQLDTGQKQFGTASGLFDGTGDYIYAGDSDDWNFGTGDFTIDFWIRFNSLATTQKPFSQRVSSSDYFGLYMALWSGDTYYFQFDIVSGGSSLVSFYSATPISLLVNTWYHFALVRNGSSWKMYVDGTNNGSATASVTSPDLAANFVVGANGDDFGNSVNGWIDEFRVSKGIARWTANFTPPTSQYAPAFNIAPTMMMVF